MYLTNARCGLSGFMNFVSGAEVFGILKKHGIHRGVGRIFWLYGKRLDLLLNRFWAMVTELISGMIHGL